jgi:uncharacterized protein (TIRG00374 family)
VLIIIYFIKKERGETFFYRLVRLFIPKKFKDDSFRFVNTFYKDFPRLKQLIFPMFLGLITWIIIFSQEYIIVISLGVNIPYIYFILLFPIANAAGFLPVTVAGLGLREYVAILIFSTLFAVQDEKILVFTLVGFVITDIFTGFIGFLVSLTEVKKVDKIPI